MKKLFALALVVLGLAACQTDFSDLDVQLDGEATICLTIPEDAATRATVTNNDSADSGLANIDDEVVRFILAIYDETGEEKIRETQYAEQGILTANFPVRLVPGRSYTFVAWADMVTAEDVDNHYITTDLKNITLNGTWEAMDETRDAFTASKTITSYSSTADLDMQLTRPFAKVRVITTDVADIARLGLRATHAKVAYTTKVPVSYDAFAQTTVATEYVNHEYEIAAYTANDNETTKVLYTDYIFANDEQGAVKFSLTTYDQNDTKIKQVDFNTDIPVKRNMLTTLTGNVMTEGNNVSVEVKPVFPEEGGKHDITAISSYEDLLTAIGNGGEYLVINNIAINLPAASSSSFAVTRTGEESAEETTTTINLNGFTIIVNNKSDNAAITIPANNTLVITGNGGIELTADSRNAVFNNNDGQVIIAGGAFEDKTEDENVGIFTNTEAEHFTDHVAALKAAFANGDDYTLTADVTLSETLTLAAGKSLVLNLNGKTINGKTLGNTNPQDLFLVNGELTVKDGTITAQHIGKNMGWGGQATIFDITAGGVVNLDGVTAKHLGGSDMNFVAHLNNWGTATFNAVNSTLESTYIAVRVFNSGPDMNNVTITNSTLKGKYCFWVHNYNPAGDNCGYGGGTDETLTINIFDQGNTFEYTGKAPILYGFNEPLYFDSEGNLLAFNAADLAKFIANESQRSEVALANDIELNEQLNITKEFTLNLNGKTITGTDTITGSFGLITNKGNLTVKNGKMTLVAVNNRGWNAYSSVISNNPGGNLVVENATIEHLGGTDMAYGIDNLTNGKGTSAVATINEGATVKSTYRAIRQFLNGIEATNSLTVNAGAVIEGANKSIWMQDPSTNANTGTLVVKEGATLNGDVYLYVCAGSTEWPVSVSIAASAVNGEVLTGNVPEGYVVVNTNGVWTVKPKELADFEAAIANGGNVTLAADMEISEPIVVTNRVVIDLNGKTITAPKSSAFVAKAGAELTIKNGTVVAHESTVRAIGGKAIVESGEYTSTGDYYSVPSTLRYSLDCREGGELVINGGTFKSNNGMINVGSAVTINGGKFENIVKSAITRHFAYVSALLTINDGEFLGKANPSAGGCFFCGAAAGCDIQITGGKFTSLWTSGAVNRIFESYYGGTINVTGGLFNTNGGITSFVTENTDEATKAAYPYVAK